APTVRTPRLVSCPASPRSAQWRRVPAATTRARPRPDQTGFREHSPRGAVPAPGGMRVKGEIEGAKDPVEARFAGPWLIPDGDYLSFVGRLFAGAGRRCLASLFLVSGA